MSPAAHERTRIKICGITSVELAVGAAQAGADLVGVMFASGSPRRVDLDTARAIEHALPADVAPVAVYQDPTPDDPTLRHWFGPWAQFHGDEDEAFLASVSFRVIRGFRFDPDQVRRWNACPAVDVLLIDGPAGGSGDSFDHQLLAGMRDEISKPVLLAGGLTAENVAEAIRIVRPYGVDVSSGVESTRGVKDPELIRAFCHAVQLADHATEF
ncbi:MAG: phosphoribosylanthranilate isomerase [Planctomycetota bacterium]|jgi:phosphoribosylanthranilate isomerase